MAALKIEDENAVISSFGALGQSATQQMFRSPAAQTELESLSKGFDKKALRDLGREAGLPEEKSK